MAIIAENLVHTGFHLHLIDPDHVEVTNLNRIVGAYHVDIYFTGTIENQRSLGLVPTG